MEDRSYAISALRQPRLGEWVRAERNALGFRTYREVSLASGLPVSTWNQLEAGRDVRVKTLVRILTFLEKVRVFGRGAYGE